MKIVELKGDQTLQALAKRLVKEKQSKLPSNELAAALLRLNPQLSDIGRLDNGTPILIPPLVPTEQSPIPGASVLSDLAEQAVRSLEEVRSVLRQSISVTKDESGQAQAWLKGEQAGQIVKEIPELKKEFSNTTKEAPRLADEQATHLADQEKALRKLQAELADFQNQPVRTSVR